METFAYKYATEDLCHPKNPQNERIPMSKIFDMVAGTSTGSLLSTALVIPAVDDPSANRYYADDAAKIYTSKAGQVFTKYKLT